MRWMNSPTANYPKDAIIFGWQGMGNAALKAAAQGHRFVMTPQGSLPDSLPGTAMV